MVLLRKCLTRLRVHLCLDRCGLSIQSWVLNICAINSKQRKWSRWSTRKGETSLAVADHYPKATGSLTAPWSGHATNIVVFVAYLPIYEDPDCHQNLISSSFYHYRPSRKFHCNPCFWVMLLTDRQTDKRCWKHNLLCQGGNYISSIIQWGNKAMNFFRVCYSLKIAMVYVKTKFQVVYWWSRWLECQVGLLCEILCSVNTPNDRVCRMCY